MFSKIRLLTVLLILASFSGYLEWGGDNFGAFLIEAELIILQKLYTAPAEAVHPFTVIPLLGQILLILSLFSSKYRRILLYSGMAGLGFLFLFMLFVGLLSQNLFVVLSVLPFLFLSVLILFELKKRKPKFEE